MPILNVPSIFPWHLARHPMVIQTAVPHRPNGTLLCGSNRLLAGVSFLECFPSVSLCVPVPVFINVDKFSDQKKFPETGNLARAKK